MLKSILVVLVLASGLACRKAEVVSVVPAAVNPSPVGTAVKQPTRAITRQPPAVTKKPTNMACRFTGQVGFDGAFYRGVCAEDAKCHRLAEGSFQGNCHD